MYKIKRKDKDTAPKIKKHDYSLFSKINGEHPLKKSAPDAYVEYAVRTRHGGSVFYFNFSLAKEMGLLHRSHPEYLNKNLKQEILRTFSLQIINEYDIFHKTPIPKKDIYPITYMATRYLQLQHPGRTGKTSGDGRSIWNGYLKGRHDIWDISSCGTGTTCLSPATANENAFFKTGDPDASYGSGRSDLLDGVCAALMSEILHNNTIRTERTLAIISFKDGSSINVRAYPNLIRPAHLFRYVKQANLAGLKDITDYYIDRQVKNGHWLEIKQDRDRYRSLLKNISTDFAIMAATLESEYIFCWMDWDGDNILTDGAIIDYGSLRQFGLFHHEYRYDDVDRMSTTITEQKNMARYIVQTFAQITDFLITKKKKNLRQFHNHPALDLFNKTFDYTKNSLLLTKIGFDDRTRQHILNTKKGYSEISRFRTLFSYFEKTKSKSGPHEVTDGITWDAIFCMRDVLRELPARYLENPEHIPADEFMDIMLSNYAGDEDAGLTRYRKTKIKAFQTSYWRLLDIAARSTGNKTSTLLKHISSRSSLINRYERITGDAIIDISDKLIKYRKRITERQFHTMFNDFVETQILAPDYFKNIRTSQGYKKSRSGDVLRILNMIIRKSREGI